MLSFCSEPLVLTALTIFSPQTSDPTAQVLVTPAQLRTSLSKLSNWPLSPEKAKKGYPIPSTCQPPPPPSHNPSLPNAVHTAISLLMGPGSSRRFQTHTRQAMSEEEIWSLGIGNKDDWVCLPTNEVLNPREWWCLLNEGSFSLPMDSGAGVHMGESQGVQPMPSSPMRRLDSRSREPLGPEDSGSKPEGKLTSLKSVPGQYLMAQVSRDTCFPLQNL